MKKRIMFSGLLTILFTATGFTARLGSDLKKTDC